MNQQHDRHFTTNWFHGLYKNMRYEEIKRDKCPTTSREKKVRQEVKMDTCPTVELGVLGAHLKKKERLKKKKKRNDSPWSL